MADKAHKLEVNRASKHDMDVVLDSASFGTEKFLEQLEGDDKLAATLAIGAVVGNAIRKMLEGDDNTVEDLNWMTNPAAVKHLAEAGVGFEWLVEVAQSAEDFQALEREVG